VARSGQLRLSIAANVVAAVVVTFGLSAAVLVVAVRRALVSGIEAETGRLADVVADVAEGSGGRFVPGGLPADTTFRWLDGKGCAPCFHRGTGPGGRSELVAERRAGDRTFALAVPASRLGSTLAAVTGDMLLWLVVASLACVLVASLLLERAIVKRLRSLEGVLGRVESLELGEPFLVSTAGDEIGRLAGVARRTAERLRDDRAQRERYIAELERTNAELRSTREDLLRSETLATVGRLAAGVAHEIGNPVAAVLGYLEILKRPGSRNTVDYVTRLETEVGRIDRILRDLLDFARPRPVQLGRVALPAVVASARRLVEPQPRWRDMALELDVPADLPLVLAQDHYATQVLVNLLLNAADACSGRGRVRVHAALGDRGDVVLTVSDDGPGIAPEAAARVFEPFFTTKAPGEGTGLGLAIAHSLMARFGGGISVSNAPTGGAVFTLRFVTQAASVG